MKTIQFSILRNCFILICLFWSLNMVAQSSDTFFSCAQIKQDISQFNSLENKHSNKKWAQNILEFHPLVDGNIHYTYILEAKDTFNIDAMMNNTRAWLGATTSSEVGAIKTFDKENKIIESAIANDNIGEASGYGTLSVVSAIVNCRIAFKNNKIKLDLWVSHFYIGTASNWSRNKSETVPVSESYPVNEKGKHKSSLGMAFVNINSRCINRAKSFLDYMEQHHTEDLKRYDNDW